MTTITLHVHQAADCLPDADTDVLVLAEGDTEMQLGAYVGEESDGPVWVDAQGEILPRVIAWAEMPVLRQAAPVAGRIGRDPDLVPLNV
jgi:hypothetical protein